MGTLFCRLDKITRIFTRGGKKIKDRESDVIIGREAERDRDKDSLKFKDATLLALKMEKDTTNQERPSRR